MLETEAKTGHVTAAGPAVDEKKSPAEEGSGGSDDEEPLM